jgi:hypothetical protein
MSSIENVLKSRLEPPEILTIRISYGGGDKNQRTLPTPALWYKLHMARQSGVVSHQNLQNSLTLDINNSTSNPKKFQGPL